MSLLCHNFVIILSPPKIGVVTAADEIFTTINAIGMSCVST